MTENERALLIELARTVRSMAWEINGLDTVPLSNAIDRVAEDHLAKEKRRDDTPVIHRHKG